MSATATTAADASAMRIAWFMWESSAPATTGSALWGRGELVEHGIQDAVRERRDALLQPRPNDARDVAIGAHCAASRAVGRASASSAARSPRIA